ncbi:MAG: hypothetical protein Q4A49_04635 [Neisseria sp.]|nr:hypothetical protein [Neisseria sp.]
MKTKDFLAQAVCRRHSAGKKNALERGKYARIGKIFSIEKAEKL